MPECVCVYVCVAITRPPVLPSTYTYIHAHTHPQVAGGNVGSQQSGVLSIPDAHAHADAHHARAQPGPRADTPAHPDTPLVVAGKQVDEFSREQFRGFRASLGVPPDFLGVDQVRQEHTTQETPNVKRGTWNMERGTWHKPIHRNTHPRTLAH